MAKKDSKFSSVVDAATKIASRGGCSCGCKGPSPLGFGPNGPNEEILPDLKRAVEIASFSDVLSQYEKFFHPKLSFRTHLGKFFPATFLTKEERIVNECVRIAIGNPENRLKFSYKLHDFLFRDRGITTPVAISELPDKTDEPLIGTD